MRLRKIHISVYLIVTVTFLVMIISMSIAVFSNIKAIRTAELYDSDVKKFRHLENIIEGIDDKAKSTSVAQMINSDNTAVMYSESYDARLGIAALNNIYNMVMADNDIQSAYIYNNITGKYIGVAGDDAAADKNIFDEIRGNYGGEIPRLTPIPRKLERYYAEEEYNVLSYVAYDDVNEDNTPVGAVIMNLKLDRIKEAAMDATGGNSQIIILDKNNGVIIDTAEETEFLGIPMEDILIAAEKCDEINQPAFCRISGEKTVINSFVMEGMGWKYINVVNYNDYFATINQIGKRIGTMAVLFAIIAAIAAVYIAKIISAPINNFITKINAVTKIQAESEQKNRNIIPLPTSLLNNYFADAVADFEEKFRIYSYGQRSEQIRDGILFGNGDGVDVRGYIVMYEIYNMQVGEIYLSHVFNMIKTYISSSVEKEFDFIVLNKRQAVALIDVPIEEVRKICEQATQDARLCDVTLSAFIGRYQTDAGKLQDEIIYCQAMSRYQLMHCAGFVYDYTQYEEDENKGLSFSQDEMNVIINEIIVSTDNTYRREIIENYLKTVSDNSVDNFVSICNRIIKLVQEICGKLVSENINEFTDINMAVLTSETYAEMVNLIEKTAEITSEIYLRRNTVVKAACEDIREYIRNNIADTQMSVASVAEAFGSSQRKISHDFKEETGRALTEEINIIRLSVVADMLLTTDEPVKNIMKQCGFVNESNFYKLFKKYYHVTPNEYKKYRKED